MMGVQTLVSAIMEMESCELIEVYGATQKVGSEEGRDCFSKETVIKVCCACAACRCVIDVLHMQCCI